MAGVAPAMALRRPECALHTVQHASEDHQRQDGYRRRPGLGAARHAGRVQQDEESLTVARTFAAPLGSTLPRRTSTLRQILGPDWQIGWPFVAPVVIIVTALLIYPFL